MTKEEIIDALAATLARRPFLIGKRLEGNGTNTLVIEIGSFASDQDLMLAASLFKSLFVSGTGDGFAVALDATRQ